MFCSQSEETRKFKRNGAVCIPLKVILPDSYQDAISVNIQVPNDFNTHVWHKTMFTVRKLNSDVVIFKLFSAEFIFLWINELIFGFSEYTFVL